MKRSLLPLCLLVLVACQKNQGGDVKSASIIQGEDDRTQISLGNEKLQKTASAIAMIIGKDQLIDNKNGTFTVRARNIEGMLCPEEKFHRSFKYGNCTAFKIADNAFGTAGHCLEQASSVKKFCEEYSLVFNFNDLNTKPGADFGEVIVKESQVVNCDKILYYASAESDDVAILTAKMSSDIPSLEVAERELKVKDPVLKIGHGHGYVANSSLGKITETKDKYSVSSTNDVFGGDSGSPLLDAETHEVVGVIVQARLAHTKDRVYDPFRSCYKEPKTKNEKAGLLYSRKASSILLPAMKSIYYQDLVEKAVTSPTIENLELVKKEVSPDLHFSLFTGEGEVKFISLLFQMNKLSVPLLNELADLIPEESYLNLLIIGYTAKNVQFSEAVFDKLLSRDTNYDFNIVVRLLPLLPSSRLNTLFDQYENHELIDIATRLYNIKSPHLKDLLKYRKELIVLSVERQNKKYSVWLSMDAQEAIYFGQFKIDGSKEQAEKLQYDYDILKAYFGIDNMSEQDYEKLLQTRGALETYLTLLHQWKTGQLPKE